MDVPETRYARDGGYHIAYQMLGEGPPDIVFLSMWFTHVGLGFPRRGSHLATHHVDGSPHPLRQAGNRPLRSRPASALPTLEEWMDDLRVVLDAEGSERPAIVGSGETSAMAILFASTYPERTSALVLWDCWARLGRASDYPMGWPLHLIEGLADWAEKNWGTGAQLDMFAPDRLSQN